MDLEDKIRPCLEMHEKMQRNKNITFDKNIKRIPLERKPTWIDFEEKIGNTTYIVRSFFDDAANEDIMKKIVRLMNDSKINDIRETYHFKALN